MNTILPTETVIDYLTTLQEEKLALELKSEIESYDDYAIQFLQLATKFLEINAMSGYHACMKRYQNYISRS